MSERKRHALALKEKVAVEAVKGKETAVELSSQFGIYPTTIHQWKRALLNGASGVLDCGVCKKSEIDEQQVKELHDKIFS